MSAQRLQKIIAQAGLASRRASERFITEGRVRVNGKVVKELGAKADPKSDTIEIEGVGKLAQEPLVYIAMHKPPGVVSTVSDPERRVTVMDLLERSRATGKRSFEGRLPRVYPVGRLDFDAEGLILLTNDGDLTQMLLHPRYKAPKTYLVKTQGQPEEKDLDRLRTGIYLTEPEGKRGRRSSPADIEVVKRSKANAWVQVTVTEGRNHLVKRMFEAIRFNVLRLVRTDFAGIEVGELPPGAWRFLGQPEIRILRQWGPK